MSIQRIQTLTEQTFGIVMYCPSHSLGFFLKDQLKKTFQTHEDFVVHARNARELANCKADAQMMPFFGGKWIIYVEIDAFSKKEVYESFRTGTSFGVVVYWTEKYKTFKLLQDIHLVKTNPLYYPTFTFSRLSEEDFRIFTDAQFPEGDPLPDDVQTYLKKNYRFNPQALCELYHGVKTGITIKTKQDIIELVGLGRNSIAEILIMLLAEGSKSERALRLKWKKLLVQTEDLTARYSYQSIYNLFIYLLDGVMEMKVLQLQGVYNQYEPIIPAHVNEKRLNQLRRFERKILHNISIPRLLNVRMHLLSYPKPKNEDEAKMVLIQFFAKALAT